MVLRTKIIFGLSLLITGLLLSVTLFAQELSDGEQEVRKKADEYFMNEQYNDALPLYSQLLSLYPKEAVYNYRYAACLVEVNKDLDKAISFLEYSLTKVEDPKVYYFLGKAYHHTYVFDYAINFYKFFIKYGKKHDVELLDINRQISMCTNGQDLVRYINDLIVLDNKKIKNENIYYSYELDDFGGRIIVKPDEYKSGIDKKEEKNSLMFISTELDIGCYSSCINKKNGRDIFMVRKMPDGTWGKPEDLGIVINTTYDEDYPYLHPGGKTLYFCSKGHNSMGGYDVFRSEYDSVKLAWSPPVNLDFPTNSPYDDILFISDANEDFAYFASNRETGAERISVYKIQIEKNPVERVFESIEQIKERSKLEVTPESEIIALRENALDVNLVREKTDIQVREYKFAEVELSNDITPDFIAREAGRDAEIMEEQVKELEKESVIALLVAEEKNSESNEKYNEAENILSSLDNITDPGEREAKREEAEQLKEEAYDLDKEAIAAYNLANSLNNAAQEKQKEAKETRELAERIAANTENKDVETLVGDLNSMRKLLNLSQEKYVSPQSEIANRQASLDEKNNRMQELAGNESDLNTELSEIEEEITGINDEINKENDTNAKAELQRRLNLLDSRKKDVENKKQSIISEVKSLKAETDNLSEEIKFLSELDNSIQDNTETYESLTARKEKVDNDKLAKEIYDKELRVDEVIAQETAVSETGYDIADKERTEEAVDDKETVAEVIPEKEITEKDTAKEVTTEEVADKDTEEVATDIDKASVTVPDKYRNEEAQEIFREAYIEDHEADSLLALADEKRNSIVDIDDPDELNKVESEIVKYESLASEKKENARTKFNRAQQVENSSLASAESDVSKTEMPTTEEIAGDSESSSESQELKTEYEQLYSEADKIEKEIISLKEQADTRRAGMENITDQGERTEISEQIRGLEERAVELQDDLQKKLSSAHEKELKYLAFSSIRKSSTDMVKDNPAVNFEFHDPELSEEENEYQRETFAEETYQNISDALQERIRFMETSLDYITDEKTRKAVEEEIAMLKEIAEDNQTRADVSNDKLQKILSESPDKIENKSIRPDALLVKATQYKPENTLVKDSKKSAEVRDIENERRYADQMYKDWERNNREIGVYEKQRDKMQNEKSRKNLDKKIKGLKEAAEVHFHNFNVIYENSNTELYEMYDELMKENRIVANHPDVELANSLEQEAKSYYENANTIRMNASTIDEYVEMSDELIKAKNLEIVALNKQKQALDLYMKARDAGVQDDPQYAESLKSPEETGDAANKSTTADSVHTPVKDRPGPKSKKKIFHDEITLLLDEENSLDTARQHKYYAETLQKKAEKNLATVNDKKKLAEQTYSKGKKKQILKGVDELEEQTKNDLVKALEYHGKSDSIKYHLYDKQLDILSEELEEIADNTTISRQYRKQATYFFNEAQDLRKQAEGETDVDNKIKSLQKAVKLEGDALNSQNVAVEVLVDVDPVTFVADNNIVKIDRLEKLNKPVDVRNVKTAQESRIIEKVAFEKQDLRDIDDANNLISKAESILEEAEIVSNQAEDMRQKAEAETSKGKKKKMMKEVEKLEDKARDMRIEAGDNYDYAHENKYYVYREGLNKVRIDNNSQEARKGRQLEKDADKNFRKANALREQAFYVEDPAKVEELLATAYDLETEALDQQQKAYNVYLSIPEISEEVPADTLLASNIKDDDVIRKEKADVTPISETKDTYDNDSIFITENIVEDVKETPTEKITTEEVKEDIRTEETDIADKTDPEIKTDTEIKTDAEYIASETDPVREVPPTVTTGSVYSFSMSSSTYYSDADPIPVNPGLPAGLVFKIQVGAFINPIPENTFSPLQPMTAEKLPGSRFKKFLVGLFRSIEVTNLILEDVRGRGYNDAFIVAYKDGVRIPLYQARNLIRSHTGQDLEQYNLTAKNEVDMYRSQSAGVPPIVAEATTTDRETSSREYVRSESLDDQTGLLYTIQIGVYRTPVTPGELFNITPVYESRSESGLIRYSTGKYNDYSLAVSEKNKVADAGVLDAFVTAYYNGKRISISEAREMERSGRSDTDNESSTVNIPDRPDETPSSVSGTASGNIVFKVQIGAYKEQVPTEVVNSFLSVASNRGLEQFTNEIGYTLYLVGKYSNYKDAADMKVILVNEGVTDAFVVAFRGDKKITVEEARNLLGQ